MSVAMVNYMTANPGAEGAVAAALRELADATRQEPGNELFILCQANDDPRAFVVYQQYVDQAAFDAHVASEHLQRVATDTFLDLLASRQTLFYKPL